MSRFREVETTRTPLQTAATSCRVPRVHVISDPAARVGGLLPSSRRSSGKPLLVSPLTVILGFSPSHSSFYDSLDDSVGLSSYCSAYRYSLLWAKLEKRMEEELRKEVNFSALCFVPCRNFLGSQTG